MPPFLADENFRRAIVRGLLRQLSDLDLVRVQDVGLRTADDETVLVWAGEYGLILLTHDRETMPAYGIARVRRGEVMPGVVIVDESLPTGVAIEALALLIGASLDGEWEN